MKVKTIRMFRVFSRGVQSNTRSTYPISTDNYVPQKIVSVFDIKSFIVEGKSLYIGYNFYIGCGAEGRFSGRLQLTPVVPFPRFSAVG